MEIYDKVKDSVISVLKGAKQEDGEYFHTKNIWKNICIEEQTNAEGLTAMEHIYPEINSLITKTIDNLTADDFNNFYNEMKEMLGYEEEEGIDDYEIIKYMKEDIAGNNANDYEDTETDNLVAEIQVDRHD